MNKTRKIMSAWFWAGLAWAILVILAGGLLSVWSLYQSPQTIAQSLDQGAPGLLAWRLSLFVVLIGFWPFWVDQIARWYSLSSTQHPRLLNARRTVALWLIALELLLGQNLFGHCMRLLAGSSS